MTELSHAIIFVSDMARSVAFYRDVLGLPVRFESDKWTEFETPGSTLALHLADVPNNAAAISADAIPAGVCHLSFAVDDLDAFHQKCSPGASAACNRPKKRTSVESWPGMPIPMGCRSGWARSRGSRDGGLLRPDHDHQPLSGNRPGRRGWQFPTGGQFLQFLLEGRKIGWTPFLGSRESADHCCGLRVRVAENLIGKALRWLWIGRLSRQSPRWRHIRHSEVGWAFSTTKPQHLVAAALKLVVHGLDGNREAIIFENAAYGLDMGRTLASVVEQGEDSHFPGNSAHFQHGSAVEIQRQLTGIREKQMRTQGQVELAV